MSIIHHEAYGIIIFCLQTTASYFNNLYHFGSSEIGESLLAKDILRVALRLRTICEIIFFALKERSEECSFPCAMLPKSHDVKSNVSLRITQRLCHGQASIERKILPERVSSGKVEIWRELLPFLYRPSVGDNRYFCNSVNGACLNSHLPRYGHGDLDSYAR